ncbi:MAG TPA: hypothetical protein VGQ82_08100, partial [Chthoniobacterales bacterium]|nr:hypothetical protein [Chthoniobacterales bacterium]
KGMGFSLQEETREKQTLDVLTDEENGLRVIVSRLGAELISLARRAPDGEWIGFLHRDNNLAAPAKGWANHATVMGYFLQRLKDERSFYRGHEIRGRTHSFLRTKTWHCVTQPRETGRLTYRIEPGDYGPVEYPLKVSLDLTYQLVGETVRTAFRFTNREPELTAHVGFGVHPGFVASSFDSFRFQMPAGIYRRHFSPANFLSGETEDIRFDGGEMPFERAKLSGSYILEMPQVDSRVFEYSDPPSGRSVSIDTGSAPYLTIWSDGGPFLCVEPCWGLTDHFDQRPFEQKEGIQRIAPGQMLEASITMTPRLSS